MVKTTKNNQEGYAKPVFEDDADYDKDRLHDQTKFYFKITTGIALVAFVALISVFAFDIDLDYDFLQEVIPFIGIALLLGLYFLAKRFMMLYPKKRTKQQRAFNDTFMKVRIVFFALVIVVALSSFVSSIGIGVWGYLLQLVILIGAAASLLYRLRADS